MATSFWPCKLPNVCLSLLKTQLSVFNYEVLKPLPPAKNMYIIFVFIIFCYKRSALSVVKMHLDFALINSTVRS